VRGGPKEVILSGMGMKSVTVDYYALFREARGEGSETLSTEAGTAAELYEELRARHGFPPLGEGLHVAVNDEFAPWDRELGAGDRVVFIAPVAGG
jgi:sulfur-carrier protein